jgi:hypothetical protein
MIDIEVEWNYKAEHDRVLVLLPPLSSNGPSCAPPAVQRTLQNLCSKESLKYILVYIPFFDPRDYEQRCLFEAYYGHELRLIPRLEKLLDRHFPDYLTSECVYMLAQPDEWERTITPIEWYFDAIVSEQLYEYYDTTSRWINGELKKYSEHAPGATLVYERVLAKLYFANDEDLVFVFGDLDPRELSFYRDILESYEQNHRLTAVYSFGPMTPIIQSWKPTPTSNSDPDDEDDDIYNIPLTLYTTPDLTADLLDSLQHYSPAYTNTVFIGRFHLPPSDSKIKWDFKNKRFAEARFFDTRAWESLLPLSPQGRKTYEPLGLLQYSLIAPTS